MSSQPVRQWLRRSTPLSRSVLQRHPHVAASTSLRRRSTLCNPMLVKNASFLERLQLRHPPYIRSFQTASDYNRVADESLEALQDALDDWMEDNMNNSNDSAEVVLASGVLTLKLPPNGTWVINKQSTTQQIWWSSPLSGPKRFEYADGAWWSTKDGLNMNSQLAQELHRCFPNASELAVEQE